MESRDGRTRHPSGVYFQDIPVDPINGCSAFLYDEAGDLGYFKIDFLNNTIYQNVRDEAHLNELLDREPLWELLDDIEMVEQLAHIHGHFGIVQHVRPRSIIDVAIVLALMRPGKRHLLGRPRAEIDTEIWQPSETGYWFKKAHALSYAASIVVQMNIICDSLSAAIDEKQ
jgi:hypothetical protein